MWEKKTNFDLAVRVPLLMHVPWLPEGSRGARTQQIAELVDVFPTLAALAGLPPSAGTEGTDLSPLFHGDDGGAVDKTAAFAQYPACFAKGAPTGFDHVRLNCNNVPKENFWAMGYSVRVDGYRFTRWLRWNGAKLSVDWDDGDVAGRHADELYAHVGTGYGPDAFDANENRNLAADPKHAAVKTRLAAQLRAFFEEH